MKRKGIFRIEMSFFLQFMIDNLLSYQVEESDR
jgi:hypothetical protein